MTECLLTHEENKQLSTSLSLTLLFALSSHCGQKLSIFVFFFFVRYSMNRLHDTVFYV